MGSCLASFRRLLIAFALSAVVIATPGVGSVSAKTAPKPGCSVKGAHTLARTHNGRLLVTHRETDDFYGDSTEVYACPAGGRARQIERADVTLSLDISHIVFTRRYVAYASVTDDAACEKGMQPDCRGASVASYDMRTGKPRARAGLAVDRLALSTQGWLATITPADPLLGPRVVTVGPSGTRTLDHGGIALDSLRIRKEIVHWTRDGKAKAAPLK